MTQSETSTRRAGRVVETTHLRAEDIRSLYDGRILAIRVPGYYPAAASDEVAGRLLGSERMGAYAVAPTIGRLGISFFDTAGNPELRETYFREARPTIDELRRLCGAHGSPIDRLRAELQEAWPHGADLGHIDGRPMFVGLARVFRDRAEALPHQDDFELDAQDCPSAPTIVGQLACNVYLRPAQEGGELELWDERYDEVEFDARRLGDTYGLDRTLIPPGAARLAPRKGELILFNSMRVHAVRATRAGARVTMSCFIGLEKDGRRLVTWS